MTGDAPGGDSAAIARAFLAACVAELEAPKPGNVHVLADGHRMTVADFRRSAEAAAPALCRRGAPLGRRILDAVAATRAAVGQNTNLGIVLLAAPLAIAAERAESAGPEALRHALRSVLQAADLADAATLFEAIRLAAPGGLGEAPRHDVRDAPTVPPLAAMAVAAGRDLIARQWTTGFAAVFGLGLRTLEVARGRWDEARWATLAVYLRFLAAFPDSHVRRRHGRAVAAALGREARRMELRLRESPDPVTLLPELLAWDAALKRRGLNPGTSADLTVATLFAAGLVHSAG